MEQGAAVTAEQSFLSPLLFPASDGATEETFSLIATERFVQRVLQSLRRFVSCGLLPATEGIRIASEFRDAIIPYRIAWHYSAGLFDDPQLFADSPERCLDQLMVSLAAIGVSIEHRFASKATPLYTPDDWCIPAGAADGLSCDGNVPLFSVRGGKLATSDVPGATRLPMLEHETGQLALMVAEHTDPFFADHIDFGLMPLEALPRQRLNEALAELATLAPCYHQWCTRAVTSAILLEPSVESMSSGSQGSCPGMIYLSATLEPVQIAEMLIHEASHQYFRGIEALGRLTNGSEVEEFYSPVVGRPRPLTKLLLAYHAFANVLAYMVRIQPVKRGGDGAFVERNIATVARDLATLAEGIEASTTLNENGQTIWAEMRARVRDALTH